MNKYRIALNKKINEAPSRNMSHFHSDSFVYYNVMEL